MVFKIELKEQKKWKAVQKMWKFKSKKDKRIEELEKELQVCKDDAWEMKVGLNAQIEDLKRQLKNEMEYARFT